VTDAAESLLGSLLEMAELESNPVLQVIDLQTPLQVNQKYPTDLLQFNQTGWRAYYHCHPASRAGNHRFKGEHGHFHIFVRLENTADKTEKWSHLVALAMDNMGQPLGWFSVNHWVTGETWESAAALIQYLKNIPFDQQTSLIERWLLSLCALSREVISDVLKERDTILEQNKLNEEMKKVTQNYDIHQDKELYLLSEASINLQELLSYNLTE
jgi:hypothetical protein